MMLPSLEVAGPGGHWVEVSRAICPGEPSDESKRMMEAYDEYFDAAQDALRDGATAHDVHRAVVEGLPRPRLPARPRHRPLDRDDDDRVPEDRRGRRDRAAREHDLLDAPARDLARTASACLYMQDTWLVTADGGVPLADAADADLRRDRAAAVTEPKLSEPVLPGDGGSDYERYLRTDELLALQKGPGEWAHRDELLFQTVHQSSELWLKLATAEVEEATRLIGGRRPRRRDQAAPPRRRLPEDRHRGARHARAPLDPWEYQEVRKVLGHGSGFDSPGFRDDPEGDAGARRGLPRGARGRGADAGRALHRTAASTRSSTSWPSC